MGWRGRIGPGRVDMPRQRRHRPLGAHLPSGPAAMSARPSAVARPGWTDGARQTVGVLRRRPELARNSTQWRNAE